MTEARHICDRCGSVILENRALLTVECGPLRTRRPDFDLCADCQDGLLSWIGAPPPAERLSLAPLPRYFLGSTAPWPPWAGGPCPICGGAKLGPVSYCLLCGNYGSQAMLPPLPKVRPPRSSKLKGGCATKRVCRKAKRSARLR